MNSDWESFRLWGAYMKMERARFEWATAASKMEATRRELFRMKAEADAERNG